MSREFLEHGTTQWVRMDQVEPELEMAPLERVAEFETELDAINFSVDQAVRTRRGCTHMQLADDMRITRAVMSKMRQGQVAVPASKFLTFIRVTRSYALLQFYAMNLGLVVKTRRQENADARKIARLESQVAEHERMLGRVLGRDRSA